jgi:hypothetical protein
MDETEIATIAGEIGATPADIITAYQQNLPEEGVGGGTDFGFMSTSGGIFRTDPATGEAVFIPSGGVTGGTSSGGSTGTTTGGETTTEVSAFDQAREVISQNPKMTDEEIRVALREQTDLSVSDVNSLIDTRDNRQLPNFNDDLALQIVGRLRDNFDYDDAVSYIESGTITSGGKKYVLTDEQKQALKDTLDAERGFFERWIPGGN